MRSAKEIKGSAKEVIASGYAKILLIFIGVFLFLPIFSLFMPPITIFLYMVSLVFMFPFCKVTFLAAKGKTIELEDILDFKGFGYFIKLKFKLAIKLFYLTIGIIVGLVMFIIALYQVVNGVDYTPIFGYFIELGDKEWSIFFIGGGLLALLCSIIYGLISLKYNLAKYYIFEESDNIDALELCKQDMDGHTMKYFLFILPFYLLIILSLFLLGIPLVYLIPYMFLSESFWYYEMRYGKNCSKTYYGNSSSFMDSNELQQNKILEEQQKKEKQERLQNAYMYGNQPQSLVSGFNNLENKNKIDNTMYDIQNQSYYSQEQVQPMEQMSMYNEQGYYPQSQDYTNGQNIYYPKNDMNNNIQLNPWQAQIQAWQMQNQGYYSQGQGQSMEQMPMYNEQGYYSQGQDYVNNQNMYYPQNDMNQQMYQNSQYMQNGQYNAYNVPLDNNYNYYPNQN